MPEQDHPQAVARLLRIHGKVQGVWYRASAQAEATRIGLRGWVRNRLDGSVEALVIGPLPAIEAFVRWAHDGPPQARVARIDVSTAEGEATNGFEQRPTA